MNFSRFRDLLENANEIEKRRLLSCSGPMAGAFINASLCRSDLRLSPATFIDAIRHQLGIKTLNMAKLSSNSICLCGKTHDPESINELLCCSRAAGSSWSLRHDLPKLKLAQIARQAGFSVTVEKVVGKNGRKFRTDVSINDYQFRSCPEGPVNTCKAEIDFSITCPTSKSNLARPCLRGIAAAKKAELKMASGGSQSLHGSDIFIPAIIETYGLCNYNLKSLLNNIAENQIFMSATDVGFSDYQKGKVKGVIVNNYYQLINICGGNEGRDL